jgi:cyclase
MAAIAYAAGLHRLTAHTYAYLQPPGTWGYSNCGLITDDGEAVLVDTQFTKPLTRRLLDTVAARLPETRITTVVTTHANGDHCWGNELLPNAVIVGSHATTEGMAEELPPARLADLVATTPSESPLGRYMRTYFAEFDFSDITLTPPSVTFTGQFELNAGRHVVRLHEVGPAHTSGDVIVHVPDDGVLFAGDILFINDHPIMWTGPIDNWIRACTRIVDTGATTIVPGHGPVTDPAGVNAFRSYLEYVREQAHLRFNAGTEFWQAAIDIPMPDQYAAWGHRERLVITVAAIYRELGMAEPPDLLTVLVRTSEAALRSEVA